MCKELAQNNRICEENKMFIFTLRWYLDDLPYLYFGLLVNERDTDYDMQILLISPPK